MCSFCFRFIGSIELQIGRRLYFQGLGTAENHGSDMDCCDPDSHDEEYNSLMEKRKNFGEGASSSSKEIFPFPGEVVESLMNGEVVLPYSKEFFLPPAVTCGGGCGEAFYCR